MFLPVPHFDCFFDFFVYSLYTVWKGHFFTILVLRLPSDSAWRGFVPFSPSSSHNFIYLQEIMNFEKLMTLHNV